jgi:DNA-binding NtrC family response regulator
LVQLQSNFSLLSAFDLIRISTHSSHSERISSPPNRRIALDFHPEWMYSKYERLTVQERLESLVVQMHRGGILYLEALGEFKKAFVSAALRDNKGNISKAAPALGLHRNTLTRICIELQIDIRAFRPSSRRPPKSAQSAAVAKRAVR